MSNNNIIDLFKTKNRFLRSAHLERDFHDPSVVESYVFTDFAKQCIERLSIGLAEKSGHRAWRLTGDYGTGKSSFALLLAHWFAGNADKFPSKIQNELDYRSLNIKKPRFLPVLVSGTRESIDKSLLRSLYITLKDKLNEDSTYLKKLNTYINVYEEISDDKVISLFQKINSKLIKNTKYTGLLIIIDELGKFLEYAAIHPEQQDVYFLQKLAEVAARSNQEPLFLVSILHQGFNAYAYQLNQATQHEWEKIAGRFDEIVFQQPIEYIIQLIASSLNINNDLIKDKHKQYIRTSMENAINLGWYGASPAKKSLLINASKTYPIHPMVLPILIKSFSRFGQNERSIYSFLLSNEPFGLQEFSDQPQGTNFYRLHNFFDYLKTNFGYRLSMQSYRNHWNLINSMIESFSTDDIIEINILKTVGIINLLNTNDVIATEEAIINAIAGSSITEEGKVKNALYKLYKTKRILHYRGISGGFCLWPHISVDLEKAYEEASKKISSLDHIDNYIKDYCNKRPIVARRHYIETGNLRYFNVHYCTTDELGGILENISSKGDGNIIIPLCGTRSERLKAIKIANRNIFKNYSTLLLAVPQPLNSLSGLIIELKRWEWIASNILELNSDKYAREEVLRQKEASRLNLEKRIHDYITINSFSSRTSLDWFYKSKEITISNGKKLLSFISKICDEIYIGAPNIHNELVNRHTISAAAAGARMRLIENILENPNKEFLGMDENKKPPEMAIYLSILKYSGLHKKKKNSWVIAKPKKEHDRCNILPALDKIHSLVCDYKDSRVNVVKIIEELNEPPFGIRAGIIPILLAAFTIIQNRNIAFYENGTFISEIDGNVFKRLIKSPEIFDLQFCKIEGIREDLFNKLIEIVNPDKENMNNTDVLDIVRPLCIFISSLPEYVLNTNNLSDKTKNVRKAILEARDPIKLLFKDLPEACNCKEFNHTNRNEHFYIDSYIETLRTSINELKFKYSFLKDELKNHFEFKFDLNGTVGQIRNQIADRAKIVLVDIQEPKLRAFCLRFIDNKLAEDKWIESIATFLTKIPPAKWDDSMEDKFEKNLEVLVRKFKHIESIIFDKNKSIKNLIGFRVAITLLDGIEKEEVVYYHRSDLNDINELQKKVDKLIGDNKTIALATLSRVLWNNLSEEINE